MDKLGRYFREVAPLLRAVLVGGAVLSYLVSSTVALSLQCLVAEQSPFFHNSQGADVIPDEQSGGDAAAHDCHCACPHFVGTPVAALSLGDRKAPPVLVAAILPSPITHPPTDPHPPPIA